jgi:hypothetical protein
MDREFKRFDRVRARRAVYGYQIGDKGVVVDGPKSYGGSHDKYYVVSMDKDAPGSTTIFVNADEIEADE